jgi:hypothetical protein
VPSYAVHMRGPPARDQKFTPSHGSAAS